MRIQHNAQHALTYGYWVCDACGREFYGGGEALHRPGCARRGYSELTYMFGPNESWQLAFPLVKDHVAPFVRPAMDRPGTAVVVTPRQ